MLDLPGAVAAAGADAAVAAHYGSFNLEQRNLAAGLGFVDLSHRDVVRIAGAGRLSWLHDLTTQDFTGLASGVWTSALILSPQGHVQHAFTGVDDGEAFVAHTEPGAGAALVDFLQGMKFWAEVDVQSVTSQVAVTWRPGPSPAGSYELIGRADLPAYAAAHGPAAGLWAFEALRIARGEPRLGIDTDARTIPNEVGWLGTAVHLDKGCYRGQETVARVHNLGRPPRRLVLLHLDGSVDALPTAGAEIRAGERTVGFVGSSARHYELGPIGLGLIKRSVPVDEALLADGIPAGQEVLVDPEIGLHFRRSAE